LCGPELSMEQLFRPYTPDQQFLLPPSLRDWLAEDHLAYFISDTVDTLDLGLFLRRYRSDGSGNVAYHPALMCKLLLYGYATGVFSSRKIAEACETDVAFRLLSAGDAPSHRTLARFRKHHLAAFEDLFIQVVGIAQDAGLVALGTLAVDGSKVRANASKHKAMSYQRMKQEDKRLKKEIGALVRRAEDIDAAEDEEFGEDLRGDEMPEGLKRRKDRLRVIQAAVKRLEERKKREDAEKLAAEKERKAAGKSKRGPKRKHPLGKPKPTDQENFTDPDSRIMNTKKDGFQQCYNVQIAVDAKEQIIVATQVGQSAADSPSLLPVLDRAKRNAGKHPRVVLADAGYKSEGNFEGLEERGVTGYIPLGRYRRESAREPDEKLLATHRMKRRMATKRGRQRYRKRKHIAEAPFGWIKDALGFRRFHLRGVENVQGEWSLMCMALNLRRMGTNWAWT
jgi:transposase